MQCIAKDTEDSLISILNQLHISAEKEALVVNFDSTSLKVVQTLALLHPQLSFVAQFAKELPVTDGKAMPGSLASRIEYFRQSDLETQLIRNASIYLFFLSSLEANDSDISHRVVNFLQVHADILRRNREARLIILAATSPTVEVDWHEHVAHMCRFQLSHGVSIDSLELQGILDGALQDIAGLSLARTTVSVNGDFCAYEIVSQRRA
ncbi:hypothetical protein M3J09_009193 [Ascochyta lentis]